MLKRTMTAALMIALVITAGSAMAQCVIGAYADAAGTESVTAPTQFVPFDTYIILRAEAAVEGANYRFTVPSGVVVTGRFMGPNGAGFEFLTGTDNFSWWDTINGFGECVIGFGGNDVLVARYTCIATDANIVNESITLSPNLTDPNMPASIEFASCSGFVGECGGIQNLLISHVIGTESKSFGAVKSLY